MILDDKHPKVVRLYVTAGLFLKTVTMDIFHRDCKNYEECCSAYKKLQMSVQEFEECFETKI